MTQVHMAVTRRLRPGSEQAFEEAMQAFAQRSLGEPGVMGIHIIRPVRDAPAAEYGILRSFASEADCEAFYESELFADWLDEVEQYAEGEPIRRKLHGLEAFFRGGGRGIPPRWKMALITWLAVFPTVVLWSRLIGPALAGAPALAITAAVTLLTTATLTWAVMPTLTKLLSPWLQARPRRGARTAP